MFSWLWDRTVVLYHSIFFYVSQSRDAFRELLHCLSFLLEDLAGDTMLSFAEVYIVATD